MEKSTPTKAAQECNEESKSSTKGGWDEIESIFDDKKKKEKEKAADAVKNEELRKARRKRNKTPTQSSERQAGNNETKGGEWVDDGLGGRYNAEGFTGRVEDGVKIFKAHVLSKPTAGQTADCPFDCDCCYI